MRIIAVLVASLAILAGAPAARAQSSGDASARDIQIAAFAERFFPESMRDMGVPGAVLVVVENGRTVVNRAWGVADVEANAPVTVDGTAFRTASLGKTFTALAVLQLVQQGALDLDAPASRYAPDIQRITESMTLRRLLLHTAGLEEQVIGYQTAVGARYPSLTDHLRARLPHQQRALVNLPAYSNYGYALAGLTVERAADTPLRDYVAQRIFTPLGMSRAFYVAPPLHTHGATIATEYAASGDITPLAFNNPYPAGSVALTANDMERFVTAFLAAYHGENNAIGPSIARAMASSQAEFAPGLEGYGFGLNQQRVGATTVWLKGGAAPKHSAVVVFLPERNAGLFIALNRQEPMLWRHFLAEFIPTFYPAPAQAPEPTSWRSEVSAYAGVYQLNRASFSSVERILSPLLQVRVTASGENAVRLVPIIEGALEDTPFERASENIFRTQDRYVAFSEHEGRQIMLANIDGDHFAFRRIAWWERAEVFAIGLLAALAITLSFPVVRLAAFVIAKLRHRPLQLGAAARAGHGLALAAVVLLGAAFACALQANDLLLGPTPSLYAVSVASLLFMMATLWAWVTIVGAWRGAGPIASRIHLTLAGAGAALLTVMLIFFNLPFFRF